MYIALDQVRTDGGFCPVALFWLEMFCEHLERTPVSARVLFIDMSSILLSSGYISVQRQRTIARERARTRIRVKTKYFSNVSALVHLLFKGTIYSHFANSCELASKVSTAMAKADRGLDASAAGKNSQTSVPSCIFSLKSLYTHI
jgi:hypothetical protein